MKIVIASDHGGLEHKSAIKEYLTDKGHTVKDVGTYSKDSCHYPIFAKAAVDTFFKEHYDRIILVCTTGEGIMIEANRHKGIRCGVGYNDEVVSLMRRHNNANAISFGQNFMKIEDVLRRVDIFLNTEFEGGRHQIRIDMFDK